MKYFISFLDSASDPKRGMLKKRLVSNLKNLDAEEVVSFCHPKGYFADQLGLKWLGILLIVLKGFHSDWREIVAFFLIRFRQNYVHRSLIRQLWSVFLAFGRVVCSRQLARPDIVVFWNQFKPENRISRIFWGDAPRYYFLHQGLLPGSISLDKCGQMAESEIMNNQFFSMEFSQADLEITVRYLEFVRNRQVNRKVQPEKGNVGRALDDKGFSPDDTVFYAGCNDYESGLFPRFCRRSLMHSPFFGGSLEALWSLCSACKAIGVNVLFKPHPLIRYSWKDLNSFERISNLVIVRQANIFECIELTFATVTLFSQAGYHALIQEKPVLCMARSPLNTSRAIYNLESRGHLQSVLLNMIKNGLSPYMKKSFIQHVTGLRKYYLFAYWDGYESFFDKGLDELVEDCV